MYIERMEVNKFLPNCILPRPFEYMKLLIVAKNLATTQFQKEHALLSMILEFLFK